MECLQAPLRTPSSPDRSRLISFALDYTRLSPTGACSQANPSQKRSSISTVRPTVHTNPSQKRSSISTVRPTVHANPLRKRGFISTVRPTFHTNPSLKRSFSKTTFKREEFENAGLSFRVGRKPDQSSSNTNPK